MNIHELLFYMSLYPFRDNAVREMSEQLFEVERRRWWRFLDCNLETDSAVSWRCHLQLGTVSSAFANGIYRRSKPRRMNLRKIMFPVIVPLLFCLLCAYICVFIPAVSTAISD